MNLNCLILIGDESYAFKSSIIEQRLQIFVDRMQDETGIVEKQLWSHESNIRWRLNAQRVNNCWSWLLFPFPRLVSGIWVCCLVSSCHLKPWVDDRKNLIIVGNIVSYPVLKKWLNSVHTSAVKWTWVEPQSLNCWRRTICLLVLGMLFNT